jgi:beta-lactamase class A
MRREAAAALICLLATVCTTAPRVLGEESDPDPPAALAVGAAPAPARPDTSSLHDALKGMIGPFDGGVGIWIADPLRREPLFVTNADEPVVSASLYKLAILLHAESLIDQGKLRHTDALAGTELTVEDALELMVVNSDNDTALELLSTFGPAAVNATLRREGIPGIHLAEDDGENVATARGIGTFFTRLAQRRLLSPAASDRMIARLERTEHRARLPAQLPEGVRVAHKTGDLDGIFHDAGIVFTRGGPRVVVVMTWDAAEASANELIARVARTVYDASP